MFVTIIKQVIMKTNKAELWKIEVENPYFHNFLEKGTERSVVVVRETEKAIKAMGPTVSGDKILTYKHGIDSWIPKNSFNKIKSRDVLLPVEGSKFLLISSEEEFDAFSLLDSYKRYPGYFTNEMDKKIDDVVDRLEKIRNDFEEEFGLETKPIKEAIEDEGK